MQRTQRGPLRARQWGKAGPIMALVSNLIIAALAQVTLAQFGFTQQETAKAASTVNAKAPELEGEDEDAPAPSSASTAAPKAAQSSSKPQTSLDKARAVQGLVSQQSARTVLQIESEGQ